MTTFHTTSDEFYECRSCGTHIRHYHELKHYSEDSGGFCPSCKDDNIRVMTSYIVYQQVWATDEVDAANTAMELDEWHIVNGTVTSTGKK